MPLHGQAGHNPVGRRTATRQLGPGVAADVGTDVSDAPPVAGGRRGEGYANVLDSVARQVNGGELAGSLPGRQDGIPVRRVGAGLHGIAARVVAGGRAGVEDDLPGADGGAEVDLQVLAGSLAFTG